MECNPGPAIGDMSNPLKRVRSDQAVGGILTLSRSNSMPRFAKRHRAR